MIYEWLKALHVAAVLCWSGGMLAAAMTIAVHAAKVDAAGSNVMIEFVSRWDRRVTTPAMLIVWGAGLALATQGQWFGSLWLTVKLGVVVALSALHGVLAGMLRRLARSEAPAPRWFSHLPPLIVGSTAAIAVLVVVKPF
ncbi:putative membrane protein [Bradyrhizobium oligotrophicum S58]|uniref:Protoporphyrinogen IX oxidase n=1 Tax=Bradyrhizobium oligotrophicum S58 TaxID=1245469 RepID=M4ZEN6_9BRAD|nr:CopD family protein [Bradyrhizobium oligotrophicum]BAM92204.1 putative membrane protein [Bradyrhizobium oligotrophicum S58]